MATCGQLGMNWNLLKQAVLKDWTTPNSPAGDCWRCCIAAVIGMQRDSVPHFLQQDIDSVGTDDWKSCDQRTQEWLNARGYVLARVYGHLSFDWIGDKQVPVIKCGPTPRSTKMGQHHAVVFVGNDMVYDPHPSNVGLTAITDSFIVIPLI